MTYRSIPSLQRQLIKTPRREGKTGSKTLRQSRYNKITRWEKSNTRNPPRWISRKTKELPSEPAPPSAKFMGVQPERIIARIIKKDKTMCKSKK